MPEHEVNDVNDVNEAGHFAARRAAPQSWLAAAFLKTCGRWGARLGMAWVGLLILLAVFAPLIANSRPLIWVENGVRSFPLIGGLNWADWAMLGGLAWFVLLAGVGHLLRKKGVRIGHCLKVWLVGFVVLSGVLFVAGPQAQEQRKYAQLARKTGSR